VADTLKPRDTKDVEDAVQWALGHGRPLEIIGHGSKRRLGRPAQTDLTLDLSGLSGVTLYEPEELVLSARAGTPLGEISTLVAAQGQMLAFEPMDYGPIFGAVGGSGTIGGALAANLSGPRRIKAGAARDHFLGFSAVSGRGEIFKSGGRVVKNVTGYDLCKLMAGAWGTLAVMTDVTIKVLPRPETEETLAILGLDEGRAIAAMSLAMGSPCDVSAAVHLPPAAAESVVGDAAHRGAVTALRIEGVRASLPHRRHLLEATLKPYGALLALAQPDSAAFWQRIRDAAPFAADPASEETPLWRISTAPAQGAELGRMIAARAEARLLYDWAGGLIWAALTPSPDAGAALVRAAVKACGGHATLVRAGAAVRAVVDVFEPQPPALAALTRRVKESFDPQRVLNPGRMWAGV
jgi:glycolate dehydrogenase FAD-binding subunit